MIYLDSAATTLRKPPSVARACAYAIDHLATPGRGGPPPPQAAAEPAAASAHTAVVSNRLHILCIFTRTPQSFIPDVLIVWMILPCAMTKQKIGTTIISSATAEPTPERDIPADTI